jgi:sigma-E factor negative regulatory protein RseA
MSEPIREQISAFLDGELPTSETELLLKRLARDADLRESFGRYALIGEAMRVGGRSQITRGFATRINATIDGEPVAASEATAARARPGHWWRPFAGVALAAGVAAVAVVAIQHRALTPALRTALVTPAPSSSPLVGTVREVAQVANQAKEPAKPYTVPTAPAVGAGAIPGARLTSYIFAHSRYSSPLGQSNVLSELLAAPDEPGPGASAGVAGGAVMHDAALRQPVPQDARSAQ